MPNYDIPPNSRMKNQNLTMLRCPTGSCTSIISLCVPGVSNHPAIKKDGRTDTRTLEATPPSRCWPVSNNTSTSRMWVKGAWLNRKKDRKSILTWAGTIPWNFQNWTGRRVNRTKPIGTSSISATWTTRRK